MSSVQDPESLLFTDAAGGRVSTQDLMDLGPEEYQDRIPPLRQLLKDGSPYHRLLAAALLTAWGQPEGFRSVIEWARNPGHRPWQDSPVTFDRFSGADSAFETLADALLTSFWERPDPQLRTLQAETLRALLSASTTNWMGRPLALAVARDPAIAREIEPDLRRALDNSMAVLERGEKIDFDLPFQAATLILPLARLDDEDAVKYAEHLISMFPNHERMLKEVVESLGQGQGEASKRMLEKLRGSDFSSVRREAEQSLTRRATR